MQNTENLVSVDAYKNEALYPIEPSNHESWQIIAAVENVYNLYLTFEWLQNCCVKKARRNGGYLDYTRLVESSTMRKLVNSASSLYNGVSREEKRDARRVLATRIFEGVAVEIGMV